MKKLSTILLAGLITSTSLIADFKVNVSDKDMDKALNILRVSDLGIGEEAFISGNYFCIDKNNLKIAKHIKIDKERKFSRYKVKRLPSNKVSIKFVATEYSTVKERIESFAKNIKGLKRAYCKNMHLFGINSFFIVDTIENEKTLTDLWNNVYLKKTDKK